MTNSKKYKMIILGDIKMIKTKDSILQKIDLIFLTMRPIDKNHRVSFSVFLTEKELRLIKNALQNKPNGSREQ